MGPHDDVSPPKPFALRILKRLLISVWAYAAAYLIFKSVIVGTSRLVAGFVSLRSLAPGLREQTDRASSAIYELGLGGLRQGLSKAFLLGLCFCLTYAAVHAARAHRRRVTILSIAACGGALTAVLWLLWPQTSPAESEVATYGTGSTPPSAEAAPSSRPVAPAHFFPPLDGPIAVRTLDDKVISLPVDQPGRFLIVDFGASWCVPCVQALPALKALGTEFSRIAPTHIYLVSLDETKEAAARFAGEHDEFLTPVYTGGRAWDHKIAAVFRVEAIPHTVLVLPDGKNCSVNLQTSSGVELVRRVLTSRSIPKAVDSTGGAVR